MTLRLDHFFMLTDKDAPVADEMLAMGLSEASPRDHTGQGTSNRRFNLANGAIEWLYVRDADEAREGPAADLNFPVRSTEATASRIGLIVRTDTDSIEPPFDGWDYQPNYFPDGWTFRVGSNSADNEEPLCICMPRQLPEADTQASDNPDWELTQLQVTVPTKDPSAVLSQFAELPDVRLDTGYAHHLAIELNNGRTGQSLFIEHDPPIAIFW